MERLGCLRDRGAERAAPREGQEELSRRVRRTKEGFERVRWTGARSRVGWAQVRREEARVVHSVGVAAAAEAAAVAAGRGVEECGGMSIAKRIILGSVVGSVESVLALARRYRTRTLSRKAQRPRPATRW